MQNVHVIVKGGVQGVGYRAWAAARAEEAGVAGWIRNRHDGTVEAMFSGEAAVVSQLVAHLWQGPGPAQVSDVVVTDWTGDIPQGFSVLPTE